MKMEAAGTASVPVNAAVTGIAIVPKRLEAGKSIFG